MKSIEELMETPAPDVLEDAEKTPAEIFFDQLYRDKIEDEFAHEHDYFSLWTCDGWSSETPPKAKNFNQVGFFQDPDKALEIVNKNLDRDLWIQVCLSNGKSKAEVNASQAPGFWLEIDFKNLKDPGTMEQAIYNCQPIKPNLVIHSGNGCHAYFLFAELLNIIKGATKKKFKGFNELMKNIVEANARPYLKEGTKLDSIQDVGRILRVPGTVNRKDPAHVKPVEISPKILVTDDLQRFSYDAICNHMIDIARDQNIEIPDGCIDMPSDNTAPPAPPLNGNSSKATSTAEKYAALPKLAKQITKELETDFLNKPDFFDHLAAKYKNIIKRLHGKTGFKEAWDRTKELPNSKNKRSEYDLSIASYLQSNGCSNQQIFEIIMYNRQLHNIKLDLKNVQKYARTIAKVTLFPMNSRGKKPGILDVDTLEEAFEKGQEGIAGLFVQLSDDSFYFDPVQIIQEESPWWIWDKHKFIPDITNRRLRVISQCIDEFDTLKRHYMDQLGKALMAEEKAKANTYKKKLNDLEKDLKEWRKITTQKRIAENAISKSDDIVKYTWDKYELMLPCKNGIYDLKKDVFIPQPDKTILNRMSTNVDYDPDATCPNFLKPIKDNFAHHPGMERYVQKLLGYAIARKPIENLVAVFYGPGGQNGKGTTLNAVMAALGDFSHVMKPTVIVESKIKKQAGANTPEIASLPEKAIVTIPETGKNKIDYAEVCNFTGQDKLPCLGKWRKKEIHFDQKFVMFINTNNRPTASKEHAAYWKRVHILKFEIEYITKSEYEELEAKKQLKWYHRKRDANMISEVNKELPGILNYLIEGYRLYKTEGLDQPQWVREQKMLYRNMSDGIEKFFDHGIAEFDENFQASTAEVFRHYQTFCEKNLIKESIQTPAKFTKEIKNRFAARLGNPPVKQGLPNTGGTQKPCKCFVGIKIEDEE